MKINGQDLHTDLVGIFDDKPTIIDFKQSNKPKREEWIEDYFYQIAKDIV